MSTTMVPQGKQRFGFSPATVEKLFQKSIRVGVPVTVTTATRVHADVLPMERDSEGDRYKFRNGKNFWVPASDIRRYEFVEPTKGAQ